MALQPGVRLGPYEIASQIGEGGMGQVYRARDTRLDRTVAVKVLPETLAGDPEFRERFDREARTISALDHPHICALYDVGNHDGASYLVMQFLEGETLESRLLKGRLPLEQALTVATEVAGALDLAHRAGIVHRDLKPGNIMLTKTGAKLLDFGLAKAAPVVSRASGASMAATAPANLTVQGMILGTFQYMAPEQLDGAEADWRSDIFAFGVVLYEMLAGRKAFEGRTQASLIGAIMHAEPAPISTIQPLIPVALDRIIRTCLAKNPDDRWQSARDLVRELNWAATSPAPGELKRESPRPRTFVLPAAAALAAVALAAGAGAAWWLKPAAPTPDAPLMEFEIGPPEGTTFGPSGQRADAVVSRDGRQVVLVARSKDGKRSLWLRPLASNTPRLLPGTEDVASPFWSPDGRWIGFAAGGKLRRVSSASSHAAGVRLHKYAGHGDGQLAVGAQEVMSSTSTVVLQAEIQFRKAAAELRPYVGCFWIITAAQDATIRIVPDGSTSISTELCDARASGWWLRGPLMRPDERQFQSPATLVGVRLRPGVAFILSGMAAHAMVGRRIDLSTIASCRALVEARPAPNTPGECIDALERFLIDRLRNASVHDVVAAALREIEHEQGCSNIGSIVDRCRVSARHLNRLMRVWIGFGPKYLASIVRFQAALKEIEHAPARSGAALATDTGYFDQSHLTKDVTRFAGATPRRLASRCVSDFSKTRCDDLP